MEITKHEKAKIITRRVSKLLHEKMELAKWELLPCKTYNNHVEISVYGNPEKKYKVEKLLVDNFNMSITPDEKYTSIKYYKIDGISILII